MIQQLKRKGNSSPKLKQERLILRERCHFNEQHLTRSLPINLREEDRPLFEPDLKIDLEKSYLLKDSKLWLSQEGVLLKGYKFSELSLPQPCRGWRLKGAKLKLKAWLRRTLMAKSKSEHARGNYLWATDLWSGAYFHWMTEVIPRLLSVEDLWSDFTLLVPSELRVFKYIEESLVMLKLNKVEYVEGSRYVEDLYLPQMLAPTGHFHPESIQLTGQRLRNFKADLPKSFGGVAPKRVYISRSKAMRRRVRNELELVPILENYEFKIVHLEDFCLSEQISILQNCEFLLGGHGAGFANMLFLPKHAMIMELRRDVNMVNNTLFNLASALELKYAYLKGSACKPKASSHIDDISVSPQALGSELKQLLL